VDDGRALPTAADLHCRRLPNNLQWQLG
jgi:hypothetical protein